MKTKSIGVRIPISLYKTVRIAEPDKTFSEIVRGALQDKYISNSKQSFTITKEEIDREIKKLEKMFDELEEVEGL